SDDAQQQNLPLGVRKGGAPLLHLAAADDRESVLLHVASLTVGKLAVGGLAPRAPGHPSPDVDEPTVGDREHPRPEPGLTPVEPGEALKDREEHLAGQVLRLGRALRPQVAGNRRREVGIQALECPWSACTCRLEYVLEWFPDAQLALPGEVAYWGNRVNGSQGYGAPGGLRETRLAATYSSAGAWRSRNS